MFTDALFFSRLHRVRRRPRHSAGVQDDPIIILKKICLSRTRLSACFFTSFGNGECVYRPYVHEFELKCFVWGRSGTGEAYYFNEGAYYFNVALVSAAVLPNVDSNDAISPDDPSILISKEVVPARRQPRTAYSMSWSSTRARLLLLWNLREPVFYCPIPEWTAMRQLYLVFWSTTTTSSSHVDPPAYTGEGGYWPGLQERTD